MCSAFGVTYTTQIPLKGLEGRVGARKVEEMEENGLKAHFGVGGGILGAASLYPAFF